MNYKKSFTNFYKTRLFFQILALLVLVLLVWFFRLSFSVPESSNKADPGSATLTINIGDRPRVFTGQVYDKMTVLDAISLSSSAGNLKFKYALDKKNESDIMQIDDHINNSPESFVFYLNSKKLDSRFLNKTYLKAGDKIKLTLE